MQDKLTLYIDVGKMDKIPLSLDISADPLLIARKFCFQQSLDFSLIGVLAQQVRNIQQQLQIEASQRRNTESSIQIESNSQSTAEFIPTICQNSRQIAKNKQDSLPVHERLYQKSVDRRRSERSLSKDTQRGNVTCEQSRLNRSSQSQALQQKVPSLYQRGMRLMQSKQKKAEQYVSMKIEKQMSQIRDPVLNQKSRLIASRYFSGPDKAQCKMEQHKRSKIQQLREQLRMQQMAQCTFKPKVNQRTQKIKPVIRGKSKTINNSFTFQPKINLTSQQMVSGISFQQRLKRYQIIKASNTQSIRKFIHQKENYDQATGATLFTPTTGRVPKDMTRPKNVHEHLYSLRNKSVSLREEKAKPSRNKVYEQAKFRRLMEIFEKLDFDRDGEIDAQRIDISTLETQTLEILSPLLAEMEELNVRLTAKQFLAAADKLILSLDLQSKHQLLWPKKQKQILDGECTFQPHINQVSKLLGSRHRRQGQSLYEYGMQLLQRKQQKLQQLGQQLQQDRLRECTFHPETSNIRLWIN